MLRFAIAFAATVILAPAAAGAQEPACTIPKGTQVTVRLAIPVSSSQSSTGEIFGFSLEHDIDAPGCVVKAAGAEGLGTVYLAGASGSGGHEGDLTLRLDTIRTADFHYVVFDDQRMRINGKNRKIASALLGFVPFAGYGAGFIRGSDVHLDPDTPINTTLDRPATFTNVGPTFSPEAQTTAAPAEPPAPNAVPSAEPIAAPPATISTPSPYVLVVTGTTDPLQIDPAFTYPGPGEETKGSGSGILIGYDASGQILFDQQFDATAPSYGLSIPLNAAAYTNLRRLIVTAGGKSASVTSAATGAPVATATRIDPTAVTFSWNSVTYPAVDCKGASSEKFLNPKTTNPATTVRFVTADPTLQCTFSDGVRSSTIGVPVATK